ncbi:MULTISPECIES: M23 family metallopeptidase [Glutamicibacter]|uniref:Peptidoglycan DD-metalloendopeptidase family protein n=1 Tax=Glutamicibacter halophytocola TaxID=1933880 RepID=A0AA94Y0Q6_9MICC|nr:MULTISPECIES: M23 family metallopeptidase [Glutamicibacter]MBF6672186.1 peptidoglycan DD-metalloendopeptidase family protein [Glutamicibacter sp. FBE19]NQD40361.1 peptidoglycan DD-metalloendopeptidase family protein [Glutamicibacter halophytocola]UUX60203.1 peptidoglycan DD-metalloendopeptidase family protein [Glutamicibacter halophytocola]
MLSNAVRSKFLRATLGGAMALALTLPAGIVAADELDDKKAQVEGNINNLEQDMEFLDADIQATDKKLRDQQAQVPAAEQALADAQSRVANAQAAVADLNNRLIAAQGTRDQVAAEIEANAKKISEAKEAMASIASEAYKRGGVSSGLDMILNMESATEIADGLDLANRAMASQSATYNDLAQEQANNENNKVRLDAVEKEISSLKSQAEDALAQEQAARTQAQNAKNELDALVASTEKLGAELEAKKPQIQAKLASQQKEYAQVQADIKERQERLLREEAERKRKAAEAEAKRKAAYEAEQKRLAEEAAAKKKEFKKKAYVPPAPAEPEVSTSNGSSAWGLVKPTTSNNLTSSFGWRPTPAGTIDYGGRGGYVHAGIDWGFGGQCGAPITAAADGEVWMAGWGGTSGNKVLISHGVVRGKALATGYHHMSQVAVSVGQHVKQGQVIGYVGTTGNSTGCHLHFETIVNGTAVNPLGLL